MASFMLILALVGWPVTGQASISREEFESLPQRIIADWIPYAELQGAQLEDISDWNSRQLGATARQQGRRWTIETYGEYARQFDMTLDAFALVVCHELGHHFGGYVLKWDLWLSAEGQADYFATHTCARRLWAIERDINRGFRARVHPDIRQGCDLAWHSESEQDLCYRIGMASVDYAKIDARIQNRRLPDPATPDPSRVTDTFWGHPRPQCRLDTMLSASLCTREFDPKVIPGQNHPEGQQTEAAESVARAYSCFTQDGFEIGTRPRCWFAPLSR